jgi:hypothetical protein
VKRTVWPTGSTHPMSFKHKGRRIAATGLALILGSTTALLGAPAVFAEPGLQSELTAVSGQGSGVVSVSPTAEDHGSLFIEDEISVHGALGDTTYEVQRAVDFNPADVANHVCTVAPTLPFGWHTEGLLTTSAAGAGAGHIAGARPPLSGTQFDLILRVINGDGTQVLMSDCLTVTVK